jgi:hypothetical protein
MFSKFSQFDLRTLAMEKKNLSMEKKMQREKRKKKKMLSCPHYFRSFVDDLFFGPLSAHFFVDLCGII